MSYGMAWIRALASDGMTLLEVLVALGLVAIATALALPSFHAMAARWRLNAAARQVVLDLKIARAQAISENQAHRLQFTLNDQAYQLEEQANGRFHGDGGPILLPTGVRVEACTANGRRITFQPRGTASTFGTITLVNEEHDRRQIVVDIAGRMRLQ